MQKFPQALTKIDLTKLVEGKDKPSSVGLKVTEV